MSSLFFNVSAIRKKYYLFRSLYLQLCLLFDARRLNVSNMPAEYPFIWRLTFANFSFFNWMVRPQEFNSIVHICHIVDHITLQILCNNYLVTCYFYLVSLQMRIFFYSFFLSCFDFSTREFTFENQINQCKTKVFFFFLR